LPNGRTSSEDERQHTKEVGKTAEKADFEGVNILRHFTNERRHNGEAQCPRRHPDTTLHSW